MKRFAVIPNLYKDPDLKITEKIKKTLASGGIGADVIAEYGTDRLKGYDCAVVLGGDGTILDVAKKAAVCGVPVAGINLGRVGYLSSVEPDGIEKLLEIGDGSHYSERMMLSLLYRGEEYTALNDFVVSEARAARMISVDVKAHGLPAYEYCCTALIFSTPTDSSGYNVSAGGPVLDPELHCTVVTPVCPHTGASCSFVYGGGTGFALTNASSPHKTVMISSDGALDLPFSLGETVTVRKSPYKVRLIRFDDEPFTKTLLRKMKI